MGSNLIMAFLVCVLTLFSPVPQEPTPPKPRPFGGYADLAWFAQHGKGSELERFPGAMFRDVGISTETKFVDAPRILRISDDDSLIQATAVVSVPESKSPYLVVAH